MNQNQHKNTGFERKIMSFVVRFLMTAACFYLLVFLAWVAENAPFWPTITIALAVLAWMIHKEMNESSPTDS